MPDAGTCRSCKALVWWARSAKSGRPMPLQEDAENGNVIIDGYGRAHVLRNHAAALAALEEADMIGMTYLSHHAVCPERGEWSRAPRQQKKTDDSQTQEAMF